MSTIRMVQEFSHSCDVARQSEGEEVSTTEEMTMRDRVPLAKRRGLHIVDFENDDEDGFQGSNFASHKSMTSILKVRTGKMPRLSSPSQIPHQDIEQDEAVTLSSGSGEDRDEGCCTTPKECRIPEPLVCPPAPKKPRAAPSKNKRIVPNFFVNPDDLESLFSVGISKPPSSCKELALLW